MYNFDPRVKLLFIILATSFALFMQDTLFLSIIILFIFLFFIIFKADYKSFYNKVKVFLKLFIFVSLIQIVFVRSGEVLLSYNGFILVTTGGLTRAINMILRFIIIFSSAAIMASENNRKIIASLTKLKIPYIFSFMIMITLRFIPVYSESFSDALVAMQLRGINIKKIKFGKKIKIYSYLLLPVVAEAVVKSQDLALAMEARGFRANKKRSTYIELKLTIIDYLIMFFIITIFALLSYYYLLF